MKNLLLTSALFLITFFALGQGAYTTLNNKKANWESASAWTKEFSWMAAAPPGPADVGGSYTANIYGVVTRNGNLSFTGGSKLNVYDTLIVKGNFTVASSVEVFPGGVLIVLGNFTSTSSSGNKIINNGNIVTIGEFSHSGGAINTNGKFYSYDTTPTFGWGASMDNVNYNGNNTNGMGAKLKSQAQLQSGNSSLYNYVNGLMGVMPIKLISFTGTFVHSQVELNWITAQEEGFSHFEVERASSDFKFNQIGSVNGAGSNTDDENVYSLNDANAIQGVNYYRLKSVDADGTFEYSSVVTVNVETTKSINVFPNPSNGYFVNVSANFALGENTQVTIYSNEGMLIQKTSVTERETKVDFNNHLASGVYILKYTSGAFSQTLRLIVK